MSTGQIHQEVFEKRIKEQIKLIEQMEQHQGLWDYLDTLLIKQILRDSIKFYYK